MASSSESRVSSIPIQTLVEPLSVRPTLYMARSTSLLRDVKTGDEYFFSGASVHEERARASAVSRFEVLERMLALPALHSREWFTACDYFSDAEYGTVHASAVLLSGKVPLRSPSLREPSSGSQGAGPTKGAVGLGLGPELAFAKRHGLLEALERHIRVEIWYGRRQIVEIGREQVADRFVLRLFALDGELSNLPFAFAAVTTRTGEDVFFVGSALKERRDSACRHAAGEALMLLDNYASSRDGLSNTPQARERFMRLRGAHARAAQAYFESKIVMAAVGSEGTDHVSLEVMARQVLGQHAEVRYSVLRRLDDLWLVRVFSSALLDERMARDTLPFRVADPYC